MNWNKPIAIVIVFAALYASFWTFVIAPGLYFGPRIIVAYDIQWLAGPAFQIFAIGLFAVSVLVAKKVTIYLTMPPDLREWPGVLPLKRGPTIVTALLVGMTAAIIDFSAANIMSLLLAESAFTASPLRLGVLAAMYAWIAFVVMRASKKLPPPKPMSYRHGRRRSH